MEVTTAWWNTCASAGVDDKDADLDSVSAASFQSCLTSASGRSSSSWSGCSHLGQGSRQQRPQLAGPRPSLLDVESRARDGRSDAEGPFDERHPSCDEHGTAEEEPLADSCGSSHSAGDPELDGAEVHLGGGDDRSLWARSGPDRGWERQEGRSGAGRQIRLSDILALPCDNEGRRLSFGSLGHVLNDEACKVCVFSKREAQGGHACRHGVLCAFCHAWHRPYIRPRRTTRKGPTQRPEAQRATSSQPGSVLSSGPSSTLTCCSGPAPLEPWYVGEPSADGCVVPLNLADVDGISYHSAASVVSSEGHFSTASQHSSRRRGRQRD
mmetsp:Transcript_82733/g.229643  ORF Transcript_82733/g.229643 Transcript_82733/m.229643 type:complete len:325 (-) Transcript_82733:185-1159(-)